MTENNLQNIHVFNNNYPYNFNQSLNGLYQNSPFNSQYGNMNSIQNNNSFSMVSNNNNNNQLFNSQQYPTIFSQSMQTNENFNYNPQMQYAQQQTQFNLIYPQKIQPYNDKDFLCKTFNFKIQYIRAFLTLSHQEKLCFFMYVQQKRLTGKIQKEKDYKELLNKIADIVNPTRKILNPVKILTEQQIKQKILENQVNHFCDQQFKRLNVKLKKQDQEEFSQFTQPKHENQFNEFETITEKKKQDFQQQQWNQGTSSSQVQHYNHFKGNHQQLSLQEYHKQDSKRDEQQNHDNNFKVSSQLYNNQQQSKKYHQTEQQEWGGWAENSQNQQNAIQNNQINSNSIQQNQYHDYYNQKQVVTQASTTTNTAFNQNQHYNNSNSNFIIGNDNSYNYNQNVKILKKDEEISQINVDKYVIKADSIWDLQLNQEQIKKSQPSIREIFGINQSSSQFNGNINNHNNHNNHNNNNNHNNSSSYENTDVDLFDMIQTNNNPSSYIYQNNQMHIKTILDDNNNKNNNNYNSNHSNEVFFTGQNQQTNKNKFLKNKQENEQIFFQTSYNNRAQQIQQQQEWQEAEQVEKINNNGQGQKDEWVQSQTEAIQQLNINYNYNYNNNNDNNNKNNDIHYNYNYNNNYNHSNNNKNNQDVHNNLNSQYSMNQSQNQLEQFVYYNSTYESPNNKKTEQLQQDSYQIDQKTLSYNNYLNRCQNANSFQQQHNTNTNINTSTNIYQNGNLQNYQNQSRQKQIQKQSNLEDQDQFYEAQYQQPQEKIKYGVQTLTFPKQDSFSNNCQYQNSNQPASNNFQGSFLTGSLSSMSCSQQQSFEELPQIDQKYFILQPLKIKLLPQELTYMSKKIKSDAFQCEIQFYQNLINYLEKFNFQFQTQGGNINLNSTSLSMSQSPRFHGSKINKEKQKIIINIKQADIKFLQNQKIIVQKIHELTKKYTKAVEQDEEELVMKSIKQSKQFYQTLSSNINKTKTIVKNILQTQQSNKKQLNVNQAGIFYSLAKLNMDTGVKDEYVQKLITNFKRDNSILSKNSFISQSLMLFFLQKMNQTNYLKNITETICSYLLDQYEKYQQNSQKIQKISRESNTPPYLLNQKIFKQQKYLEYLKGLIKIAIVCERLITLTKLTSFKLEINLIKISKIIKEMKNLQLKNSSLFIQQQPMIYEDYASRIISSLLQNRSIYELHSMLMEMMKQQSICKICFGKSGEQLKGDFRDQNSYSWCHFGCYNLLITAFQAKS